MLLRGKLILHNSPEILFYSDAILCDRTVALQHVLSKAEGTTDTILEVLPCCLCQK